MRKQQVTLRGILIAAVCSVAIVGVTLMRLSEAQGRQAAASVQLAAASSGGGIPAAPVPAELRRALAGTCEGYNLELEHAAGTAQRAGNVAEAARLMGMRQGCSAAEVAQRAAR